MSAAMTVVIGDRLRDRLHDEFIQKCCTLLRDQCFVIEERAEEGKAKVELMLPDERECLRFLAEEKGGTKWFQYLAMRQSADGALLVPIEDGRVAAHIVECKRTLDSRTWPQVKQQFAGALYRLRAVTQALELRIEQVTCYTACRENLLVRSSLANMVQRHPHPGTRNAAVADSHEYLDHAQGQANLGPPFGSFPHRDIELDKHQGCGRVDIGVSG